MKLRCKFQPDPVEFQTPSSSTDGNSQRGRVRNRRAEKGSIAGAGHCLLQRRIFCCVTLFLTWTE